MGDWFLGGKVVEDGKGKGKGKEDKRGLWGYEVGWCVNALEVENGDLLKARGWLRDWAVSRGEMYERAKQG